MDGPSTSDKMDQTPYKKVTFQPTQIGPVSTLEEMDIKVLKIQNKKLAMRLEDRKRIESDLRQRVEQLEKRQTQDDAVLNVINRYWNQLNEDIRVMLLRFDSESAHDLGGQSDSEAAASFLSQLSTWDKEELNEKLANRVQVSKRAVGKLVQVFDRLLQKQEKMIKTFEGRDGADDDAKGNDSSNADDTHEDKSGGATKVLKDLYMESSRETLRVQMLLTSLQEQHHTMSLKMNELRDTLHLKETEIAELKNRVDDIEYENSKIMSKNCRIEHQLAESLEKLSAQQHDLEEMSAGSSSQPVPKASVMDNKKIEELVAEHEDFREMHANTLRELETLNEKYRESLKKIEIQQMDLKFIPENIIVDSPEYRSLQSHFSVLHNDLMVMKSKLDQSENHIQFIIGNFLKKIEAMEAEELNVQKRLRAELLQMEDVNAQLRKEYEMLRMEFEQIVIANAQTAPINKEMRQLITAMQNHNTQLKNDVNRYKRKYKEITIAMEKMKRVKMEETAGSATKERNDSTSSNPEPIISETSEQPPAPEAVSSERHEEKEPPKSAEQSGDNPEIFHKKPTPASNMPGPSRAPSSSGQQTSSSHHPPQKEYQQSQSRKEIKDPRILKDMRTQESGDYVKDLLKELKKVQSEKNELKLLLDMHKGVSKEKREKVFIMASEKKLKAELEEMKQQIRKIQEAKRDGYKKMADEDAQQKIKQLDEQVHALQKQVQTHKQEESALLSDMDVTGQAYEDLQEQNSRLLDQLREKDEANFKLITERIKSNQLYKISKNEKETLQDLAEVQRKELKTISDAIHKLEEAEMNYTASIHALEKEGSARNTANEMYKAKAIENVQSAADLKIHLDRYQSQLKELQQLVGDKTCALEAESFKNNRLQEEMGLLKKKVERMKKIETSGTPNLVLMEEIREYKEMLTCPSCKVKRKDAVLTKCFHVFCWDCLKARYETRQRKCPKCNAAFGANDYHRLYLGN